jgi:hypothetical protein
MSTSSGFPNGFLPRTRFNVCSGLRSSLFKYNWQPTTNGGFVGPNNGDSVTAGVNLSTAGKYFVYIEDSLYGVCKDTLEVDVKVVSSYDVKPDSMPAQCFKNGFIQLNAATPYNITNPGGKWSGIGIVNDSLGVWDPIKSGKGKFWVVYSVTGDACAATDSTEIEIVGLPDPTLLAPDSLCGIYGGGLIPDTIRHRLVPKNPGGWFTGVGVDSTTNGRGEKVYWVDGTKFSPTTGNPDTAIVRYTLFEGCLHDSVYKIPVVAPWDNTFLGTYDNGKAYLTTRFCMTAEPDTMAVAGPNPVWYIETDSAAMIDINEGVIDPRIVGLGKSTDVLRKITVGNYGFCGQDTTFTALFVKAPEIEIVTRSYCDEYVQDPANRTKVDTAFFRIPKGPLLGGSTGKKTLDPNGLDTASEALVWYGDIGQTGWSQAYAGGVPNQYLYNYWDGKPWMTFPNVARYRMSNLKNGSNLLRYQFAFKYRDNHPTKFACFSYDSTEIFKMSRIELPTAEEKAFCDGDEVSGFAVDSIYDNDYALIWYIDTTKDAIDTTVVGDTIDYYDPTMNNKPGSHALYARYIHKASGCMSYVGVDRYGRIPYKVYSYPKVTFVSEGDTSSVFAPTSMTYSNTTEYDEDALTYHWQFAKGENYTPSGGSSTSISTPYQKSDDFVKGDGLNTVTVSYQEAVTGADKNMIRLYGVNSAGCADSSLMSFEVGTEVEFVWPNVFTPGKDGYNDWWFIVPPEGTPAYGCEGPDCFDPNIGEAGIREWFDRNLEMFEGYIYDRWGRKVFELTKENPIWKGQSTSGGEVTDGVYMYSIRYKSKGSEAEERQQEGTITLIREK